MALSRVLGQCPMYSFGVDSILSPMRTRLNMLQQLKASVYHPPFRPIPELWTAQTVDRTRIIWVSACLDFSLFVLQYPESKSSRITTQPTGAVLA
ncbi:hypothetical protein AVEN_221229-1 [Araneus ventricosus]|uniref:Uncharacterized protein n=1 Tax=Araneus ventricosus TaxID=182803 RepID=A0A4Y2F4L0_ARAVE|nr:hypothetical protein AVEN_221229-1 [Araneus ventricosus]